MTKPKNHDEYIAQAPEYARPILEKIRAAVHAALPDVEETMKWSTPHFDRDGILLGMAAFKEHARLGFWRATSMKDPEGLLDIIGKTDIGVLHAKSLKDLPTKAVLARYVKEAARVNAEARAKPKPRPKKKATRVKRDVEVPADLAAALAQNKRARTTFDAFSYTNQREYVEWLEEAKREATRAKRLQTAIDQMEEGKPRNWKYMPQWR